MMKIITYFHILFYSIVITKSFCCCCCCLVSIVFFYLFKFLTVYFSNVKPTDDAVHLNEMCYCLSLLFILNSSIAFY
ncbi:hypothetical protein KSF78_0000471 [Schistosoma japonicum]|nr:hypothetical protein KSF78_0000471 [Schistosoma japonicum]